MKKTSMILVVFAMVLTMTQCRKNEAADQNETVTITLDVKHNNGAKVDVNPTIGTVDFESGDKVYVGSGGKYVGFLTHNGTNFVGNITNPTEGQPLQFYFLGNVIPQETLSAGTTEECSVVISDQTEHLPVISCAPSYENYVSGVTAYTGHLLNKCALVKFNVTTPSNSPICITGMKNKVTVDFSQNTVTPSMDGEGVIKLPAGSGENVEKWAILLPQEALGEGEEGSAYTENGAYLGTRGTVPTIDINGYYDTGIEVNITSIASIDYEYVDLGLPSGTLWATCNVGANAPEEYGDYFAWGETQPKDTYNWSTYQYCNGSNNTLTKYCNNSSYGYNGFTDDLITLLPEDDAATANWGEGWRMPTKEEWEELYNNTTVIWTTQNGVNGMLFTADNSNSLFLPAAGSSAGSGHYWSSSLYTDYPSSAWGFSLYSDIYGMTGRYCSRCGGRSVRAVRVGLQNNAPTGAINGKFTINGNGDQVYFSQGNLQYIGSASTPYWKFAEYQWDYLGATMGQNGVGEDVDRDLFGWGMSGCDETHLSAPYVINTLNNSYYAYGSYVYNLYDQTGQADWGYNSISNGGNTVNQWRTPTQLEWNYVLNTRNTASGIRYAKANVNNVNGVILLPDDWDVDNYSINNTNSSGASYTSNIVTVQQWAILENAGTVFLPATGYRKLATVYNAGSNGYYWSASQISSDSSWDMSFSDTYLGTYCDYRHYGYAVRLVQDYNP